MFIFINFSLASRCSQLVGDHANEIKHGRLPVVYVVKMKMINHTRHNNTGV